MIVNLSSSDDEQIRSLIPEFSLPVPKLVYNSPASIYIGFKRLENVTPSGKLLVDVSCFFMHS
jgi:coatomer protein complex subunit gamma